MPDTSPTSPPSAEVAPLTLRETLLTIREYSTEIRRKWYWYALFCPLFLAYNYYKAHQIPTTYQAATSIMINGEGGAVSGLLQLAGQFGLGGGGEMKTEKLLDLLISQRMVLSALLQNATINGKTDLIANHFLDKIDLKREVNDTILSNFRFVPKKSHELTLRESTVMQAIYRKINNEMLSASIGKSGIVKAICTAESEGFAKEFMTALATTLSDYYADKTVEQQNRAYRVISQRCDSLERVLYGTEYALANWIDDNRTALRAGSLPAKQGVKREQYKREAEVLNVMYIEAIKNRELAHINLLLSTPSVQIIDYPQYPLQPQIPNRLNMYIVAILSAITIVTIGVIFNKMLRNAFG